MRASRAIVAIVATLALVSCSLFVSLDDLSGGADAGSTGEAGTNDATPSDAGDATSSDAHQDTGAPFCASFTTPPALCDDFDETAMGAAWDAIDSQDAGMLTLDKTAAISAPYSLLAIIPSPVDNVNEQSASLTKTWTTAGTADASQMHCEVDIREEKNGPNSDYYLLLITQSVSGQDINYSSFGIIAEPDQWAAQEYEGLSDGGEYEPAPVLFSALPGLWRHFVIDLNFKTEIVSYAMTETQLDGTTSDAGAVATTMIAPQTTYSRDFSIGVGPNYAPLGTTTWQARFDNAWCTFTP